MAMKLKNLLLLLLFGLISITSILAQPTAGITYNDADAKVFPTQVLRITATFSEDMSDSPVPQLVLSAPATVGTINMSKTDATHYYYDYTVENVNGVVSVTLATGTDVAGNVITAIPTSGSTFEVDNIAPTITISTTAPDPTNVSPIYFTVQFSEDVANFVLTDITVSAGTRGNFTVVDANTYTFSVSLSSDAILDININAGVCNDIAGNTNQAATQFEIEFDKGAPYITFITFTETSPTNASPIHATIQFNENVHNLIIGDIDVTNGIKSNFVNVDDDTYTIQITPVADGTVSVQIPADVCDDGLNLNLVSSVYSITSDRTVPTITSISSTELSPTKANTIPISIAFSESVTGFTVDDISVTNGTKSNFAGTGSSYSFDITPLADGLITVNIVGAVCVDVANNGNTAATQFTITSDRTAPTVTISSTKTSPTNATPIPINILFGEVVTGFTQGDITVSGNGTVSGFAGSGDSYSFNFTPTADGIITVNIAGGVCIDAANNSNTAATQFSITSDRTYPELNALTITSNNASYPNIVGVGGIITLTITGSESLVIVDGDIQIEGHNATILPASSPFKNWTATYTMQSLDPTPVNYKIDFKDLAGNSVTGVLTPSSIIFDEVAPTLTSVSISSSNTPSNTAKVGDVITILFTADDDIKDIVAKVNSKNAIVTYLASKDWKAEYTMSSLDVDGLLEFTIDFKDYAGNLGSFSSTLTPPGTSVTFDKIAPSAPTKPDMITGSDSGTSSSDDITNNATPTFVGTAEPNSSIKLYSNIDGFKGTANADGAGNWSITASALAEGNHIITATATDATGNVSPISLTLTITIDLTAPGVPGTPGLDASSNSGVTTDNITNDNTPTFVGTAETYSIISLYSGAALVATTTTNIFGIWSATASILSEGINTITAIATDVAGNTNITASPALVVTIDITPPPTPLAPDLDAGSDTGVSSIDNVTGDNSPTFTGAAESGSTVKLYNGATEIGSSIATAGSWTITSSTLTDGAKNITVTATDEAGNVSGLSIALPITVDIIAPSTPSKPDMTIDSDSGTSSSDDITSNTTPIFTGTADANTIIKLYSSIDGLRGTTNADGTGIWSITASALAAGNHSITATASDVSGNVSGASTPLTITIDASAPVISSVTVPR